MNAYYIYIYIYIYIYKLIYICNYYIITLSLLSSTILIILFLIYPPCDIVITTHG